MSLHTIIQNYWCKRMASKNPAPIPSISSDNDKRNVNCYVAWLLACSLNCVWRILEHDASNWLLRCLIILQVKPGDPNLRHRPHQCSFPEGTGRQTAGQCPAPTALCAVLEKRTEYI